MGSKLLESYRCDCGMPIDVWQMEERDVIQVIHRGYSICKVNVVGKETAQNIAQTILSVTNIQMSMYQMSHDGILQIRFDRCNWEYA